MSDIFRPRDTQDIEAAVQDAVAGGHTLEVIGRGSKRTIGRAAQCDRTLDLSALSGITLYEPNELVLSARAGTPLAEIEAALAAEGQELAFEPLDYAAVLGQPAGATLGGVIAANLAGPRRIKAGAARDHFLGFTAVSGRGETFKSGARVVKNVTGYDLPKLVAGSWGTLAVLSDVTVKVLPRAESEETVLIHRLGDADAVRLMSAALGSATEISAAAHAPATSAGALPGIARDHAVTAFRLEGVPPSIMHRRALLEALLPAAAQRTTLAADASRAFWRAVRDVAPFAAAERDERPLWRISTAPMNGPALGARLRQSCAAELLYDWAGGLVWARLPPSPDAGATEIRAATAAFGGHATLIRAPTAVRASVDVFAPQDAGVAAISRRVKDAFDPKRVLNPGRMYPGV